jgi:DNA-directed RNA polymerase specialized sigma subunit
MNFKSPRPQSNIGKVIAVMKQDPERHYSDSEVSQIAGVPKVTVSNAFRAKYICRDSHGKYYLSDAVASRRDYIETVEPVDVVSEDELIRKAIQRKIDYHLQQIERLKELLN